MSGFSEYDNSDGLGLAPLVRAGEISATELLDEAIDRTERVNGQLNAVVHKLYVAAPARRWRPVLCHSRTPRTAVAQFAYPRPAAAWCD